MKFTEAEFDRPDKDKKGQLDLKELEQSKLRVSHPVKCGEVALAPPRFGNRICRGLLGKLLPTCQGSGPQHCFVEAKALFYFKEGVLCG
jgi:hypothetical protein